MVKEIRCYEDSSGKVHKTEHEAHQAELAIWLHATGEINEASAQKLAEHMAANAPALIDTLAKFSRDVILKGPGPRAVVA